MRPRLIQGAGGSCVRPSLAGHGNALMRVRVMSRSSLSDKSLRASSTYSVSQGPTQPPLLSHTIPQHFAEVVSSHGDDPAVISRSPRSSTSKFPDVSVPGGRETILSYAFLDSSSNDVALSLRSLGVKKGDRVAINLGNIAEHSILTYAIFKLGAILVPLNPAFNATQIGAALSHLGVEILIIGAVTDRAYRPCQGRSNLELLQGLVPDLECGKVEAPSVPTLRTVVVVDNTSSHPLVEFPVEQYTSLTPYSALMPCSSLSSSHSVIPDTPLQPNETINIQFTSGTTSSPKAAMLSHTGILNNGRLIAHRMGLNPSDRIVCPPPLFHCFGCILGFMATATTGASILFLSPAFDPLATLRMAADHKATGLYGVATMFISMLELLAQEGVKSNHFTPEEIAALPTHLSKGIAAGSSIPESLMRKLYDKLGVHDLVICYGMTETSPVSCMTTPTDPFEKRISSVGRVMPHTRAKIVDPVNRSKILPVGQRGELATSGYLVMEGYWGDEERTREVRISEPDVDVGRQGGPADVGEPSGGQRIWMYTGDEARMDADGYVEITGRIKDLIIRGGENIHPLEIENCLMQHPLVADASIIGVPDDKYGECIAAFIIPSSGVATEDDPTLGEDGFARSESQGMRLLTKSDVREWVGLYLSSHLVPKYVFWTDDYPKTASGKIQKYKLREWVKEMIHMSSGPGCPDERHDQLVQKHLAGQSQWED